MTTSRSFSKGGRKAPRPATIFLLLWLLASLAGMALGGHWWAHYYQQLIPPLALLASCGLFYMFTQRKKFGLILALAVMTLAVAGTAHYYFEPPYVASWALYESPWLHVAERAAEYIRANTTEDDRIYVAFDGANVCYLSDRLSASPHMFKIHALFVPEAYDRIVQPVNDRVPIYVLARDRPLISVDPDGHLWRSLQENYTIETTFDGMPLYRRRS